MDSHTPEQRRRTMQAVKAKNTRPELQVRRALHRLGFRFRIHRPDLPGRPDIVLPKYQVAIFVHGCFWHAHECVKGRPPKSNLEYWLPKLKKNETRDRTKAEQLTSLGWQVAVIWQCETKDDVALAARLRHLILDH